MFTQAHRRSPMYFSRNADAAGGVEGLPSSNPIKTPKRLDTTNRETEHEKQIRILLPLTNTIAQKFNGHTVGILDLIQKEPEKVLGLAHVSEVVVGGIRRTVLSILIESMREGSWSVVGHESVRAINDFAEGLNVDMLKKL